jgi:hypothetical protein
MPVFRIDDRRDNEARHNHFDRIGSLQDACRAAFDLADDLSRSQDGRGEVRWIEVYERDQLLISMQVTIGEPLVGRQKGLN